MSESDIVNIKIKQTNTNQTFDLSISKSLSILELKQACVEKSGLNETQQNLVFKGRILADDKFMTDYNIQSDNTLILVKKVSKEDKNKSKSSEGATQPTINPFAGHVSNPFLNNNAGLGAVPGELPNIDMNTAMTLMQNPEFSQMMSSVINIFLFRCFPILKLLIRF
jgi:hypothetical protein